MLRLAGRWRADGRQATEAHEHLAVAGDHEDVALRLAQRESQAKHGGAAHAAPQREVEGVVAARGDS